MHFGLGGRQCIGKTVAQTNIYKVTATLLRLFEFELADGEGEKKMNGSLPAMNSVGISDLEEPLMVRAKLR
jgi:cytochrome P450